MSSTYVFATGRHGHSTMRSLGASPTMGLKCSEHRSAGILLQAMSSILTSNNPPRLRALDSHLENYAVMSAPSDHIVSGA